MRYIQKDKIPQEFIDEVKELELLLDDENIKRRDVFDKLKCKSITHKYILEKEQNNLCGYCEAKIKDISKSHLEHIEALHRDKNLVFDYLNLIVSCNGTCFNDNEKRLTCGHKKDTKGHRPDYNLFLSPTKIENIRDYFTYNQQGNIGASSLDKERSIETLRVLNLNDPNNKLSEERVKALVEFREKVSLSSKRTGKSIREIIKILLARENLAFISFLRFNYKRILLDV